MTDKQIELAKSWFVLAEIFMMLAGFLFVTAGVAWTNSINTLNMFSNLLGKVDTAQLANCSSYTTEAVNAQMGLFKTCIIFAFIFAFLSLLFWRWGRIRLERINEK